MGIWNRFEDGFWEFLDNRLVEFLTMVMAVIGISLFFGFWFSIYIISIPLRWLWVHRLREGVTVVLEADRLKEAN